MPFVKGQRGGPGRPRKADTFARPIARAEKQIADHLPELIGLQLELARGVTIQETDAKTGAPRIYTRAPDREAGQYLINRILGKPTERTQIAALDMSPIQVRAVDYRTGLDVLKPAEFDYLAAVADIAARSEDEDEP